MIASVYLLRRMPRRMGVFDYLVPGGMKVQIGDLIEVPFKNTTIMAIVRSVGAKQTTDELRPLTRVITPEFFSVDGLVRLETIARAIVQSPSSMLYTAIYGVREQSIDPKWNVGTQAETRPLHGKIWDDLRARIAKTDPFSIQLSFSQTCTLASWLRDEIDHQLLIIFPWEAQTRSCASRTRLGENSITLHGKTPPRERAAIIEAWRTGECKTLVSTRQGSLLPAKNIGAILIADATSSDHMNWDRNPRYDARLAAELLAREHQCPLIFAGNLPRTEDLARSRMILATAEPTFQIVNLRAQEEKIGLPLITETLKTGICAALQEQKSVLCSFNRKGFARRLQCGACEKIPTCGTCGAVPVVRQKDIACPVCQTEMWRPKSCPSCGSPKVKLRGIGNARLASVMKKTFPGTRVAIIDKEHPLIEPADIYLVTEFFFHARYAESYQPSFGLVAELAADLELTSGNDRAAELLAQKIYRLEHLAREHKAPCLIQTWLPDLIESIKKPTKFLKNEWEQRKSYDLPPSTERLVIDVRGGRPTDDERTLFQKLKQLPGANVYESANRWDIHAQRTHQKQLTDLLNGLSDRYRIQPTLSTYEPPGSHTSK